MKKFNAADHIYAIDEGDNGVHIGGISVVDKHIEEQQRRIEELESHVEMMRDALTQAKYACRTHHKQGLGYEPYKAVCGALESVPKNNLAHVKAEAVLGWGKANAQARKIHKAISPNLYAKQLINGEQQ